MINRAYSTRKKNISFSSLPFKYQGQRDQNNRSNQLSIKDKHTAIHARVQYGLSQQGHPGIYELH